jgi:methionine aminopeptidase
LTSKEQTPLSTELNVTSENSVLTGLSAAAVDTNTTAPSTAATTTRSLRQPVMRNSPPRDREAPHERLPPLVRVESGLDAYAVMLAAQEAGRAALVPGALAREVNAACREPIEAAFRHRMGHGIGLDVHERPFLSPEDETVLEAGMTFTDEPSLLLDGRFGVRIEDVVVCAECGGRRLNRLVAGPIPSS